MVKSHAEMVADWAKSGPYGTWPEGVPTPAEVAKAAALTSRFSPDAPSDQPVAGNRPRRRRIAPTPMPEQASGLDPEEWPALSVK